MLGQGWGAGRWGSWTEKDEEHLGRREPVSSWLIIQEADVMRDPGWVAVPEMKSYS